jgi:hypothetical protein
MFGWYDTIEDELKTTSDELWQQLILLPEDYGHAALFDKDTRDLMAVSDANIFDAIHLWPYVKLTQRDCK